MGEIISNGLPINRRIMIAEGFAIAGIVWTAIGDILTSWKPSIFLPMTAFMIGSYIFIAIVYNAGAGKCTSYTDTPFGEVNGAVGLPSIGDSCGMQTAIFALSIITA